MLMPSCDRTFILLLLGVLAVMNGACSRINAVWRSHEPSQPIATSPDPSPVSISPANPEPAATPTGQPKLSDKEAYQQALDAAYSAATIGQSAQSADDWQLAISRWQEAIKLLKAVPSSSPYHAIAQPKITEYQRSLTIAQQQASRPPSPDPAPITVATQTVKTSPTPSPTDTKNPTLPEKTLKPNRDKPTIFKAPIKRRVGRTPVIEVTFNGEQTFEMVVDTGASGTVVTQAMAQSLGIVPEGEVVADTASAKGVKFPIGKVKSIGVEGAVQNDFPVAIAGSDLELGLLGQDFYSHYDVVIRQDVVEFQTP
ncbi:MULTISPECIES: retropepsin-like aspartic protease family protein [unclassified Coleofasciculus]|uniref:retropepsin-like aspartic protease family protein n=1 Tax=unclassified Coleofasciculus TaxID=2692782 RepID=UPI00187F4421|nr:MULTISPECIES: retropepsin-like aspartic protease [unclassified Coleofasciculus]MBE9125664.1 retroviral-like aspartic protease family protein [Coleofasciculus sp. LEGE 07081]MBE9148819.1 retroviral-like aspartic protease family protein [Coleofasciculus sp. LEGE 07092]